MMFMTKSMTVLMGVGLAVLWLAGLGSPTSVAWVTWLDFVAGLWAFGIVAGGRINFRIGERADSAIALSVGLFAIWIVGLTTIAPGWQSWWNFGFACGFLVTGFN